MLTLFLRHTSASLLIQESADPAVRADLERFFSRLVPDGEPLLRHQSEGPDDMPAHVRAALTAVQLSIRMNRRTGRWAPTRIALQTGSHRLLENAAAVAERGRVAVVVRGHPVSLGTRRGNDGWPGTRNQGIDAWAPQLDRTRRLAR